MHAGNIVFPADAESCQDESGSKEGRGREEGKGAGLSRRMWGEDSRGMGAGCRSRGWSRDLKPPADRSPSRNLHPEKGGRVRGGHSDIDAEDFALAEFLPEEIEDLHVLLANPALGKTQHNPDILQGQVVKIVHDDNLLLLLG